MTRTSRLFIWPTPTAVIPAVASRWAAAWATDMKPSPVSRRATKLSSRADYSSNSCKTNERTRTPGTGRTEEFRFGHQSHCRRVAATALSRRLGDIPPDWRRHLVALPAAGRGLPGPIAPDGRDHHAMARPCRRGSRAADHRARGGRDERHPENDRSALYFTLRPI